MHRVRPPTPAPLRLQKKSRRELELPGTPSRFAVVACRPSLERVWSASMSDITRILSAIDQGDPHAAEQLLPLVYDELRRLAAQKLASERPGQTLQATALVHEAYVRLVASARPSLGEAPSEEVHWD